MKTAQNEVIIFVLFNEVVTAVKRSITLMNLIMILDIFIRRDLWKNVHMWHLSRTTE